MGYEKAAQQGHDVSQNNLGLLYLRGEGCEQSYELAAEWLGQAALQGLADAMNGLGCLYRDKQSFEKAAEWFEQAARRGYANAMTNLGCLYRDGTGHNQSFERAAEWFEQAARRGNAKAQNSLGSLLANGQGVPQNPARALELFKQSAAQGNTMALANLGFCHEFGNGVTQNYQEARRLYASASAAAVGLLDRLEEKIRAECPFLDKQVVITGTSREDLNSRTGTATSFDNSRGRYVVDLDGQKFTNVGTEFY